MLKDIYVIDNVFLYPDEIVKWANTLKFFQNDTQKFNDERRTYWKGKRTYPLHKTSLENKEKTDLLVHDIFNGCFLGAYDKFSYNYNWEGTFYFHRLDKDCIFENSWIHTDARCIYAGVVYLNKNPPLNSGTMIFKDDNKVEYIENIYNRLVLYKSKFNHSAMCGFGENENSRLTFTAFFNKIDMTVKSDDVLMLP
jgi:hypothetical protein